MIVEVHDPNDPRLVEVAGLTDAQARARTEAAHGCFVVEGILAIEAALGSKYPLRTVLVDRTKLARIEPLVSHLDIDIHVGDRALLEAVTGFPIHRGVVASAGRLGLPEPATLLRGARHVAVVEGVNDHENLGALFRNAAAFGVDAVLLDPTTADPLYRRSVRVSLGHVLGVPWTRIGALPGGLDVVRDHGLDVAALTPAGDLSVHDIDRHRPVAWIIGAEGPGLTAATLEAADHRVRIPIADGVDSLNVATAAAVAFSVRSTAG